MSNIDPRAVDAVEQALYEDFRIDIGMQCTEWPALATELDENERHSFQSRAKFYTEAVAPYLYAQALRDAAGEVAEEWREEWDEMPEDYAPAPCITVSELRLRANGIEGSGA